MNESERLAKEHGGVLARQRKHRVWKFPDGRIFVMPSTPSDRKAEANSMSDLRRFLGIKREIVKNPDRKAKQGTGAAKAKIVTRPKKRQDPFEGVWFRIREAPYRECLPVDVRMCPRTPIWAILLHLFPLAVLPAGTTAKNTLADSQSTAAG